MKSSTLSALALVAASVAALLVAPAFAQNYGDKTQYNDDDIVIIAPRAGGDRDPATGARVDTIAEQRLIETKDLDLRDDRDVHELYRRIDRTVDAACSSVNRQLDAPSNNIRDCVQEARDDAKAQADRLIADAHG